MSLSFSTTHRYSFCLLSSTLLLSGCFEQDKAAVENNALFFEQVTSAAHSTPIKKQAIYNYIIEPDEVAPPADTDLKNDLDRVIIEQNKQGFVTLVDNVLPTGVDILKYRYTVDYDKKLYQYQSTDDGTNLITLTLDKKGNILAAIPQDQTKMATIKQINFDEKGRMTGYSTLLDSEPSAVEVRYLDKEIVHLTTSDTFTIDQRFFFDDEKRLTKSSSSTLFNEFKEGGPSYYYCLYRDYNKEKDWTKASCFHETGKIFMMMQRDITYW